MLGYRRLSLRCLCFSCRKKHNIGTSFHTIYIDHLPLGVRIVIDSGNDMIGGESANCQGEDTALHENPEKDARFRYPREVSTLWERDYQKMTGDGKTYREFAAIGIPDGVSSSISSTLVQRNLPRRLYIMANEPVDERSLRSLDKFYGHESYPVIAITAPKHDLDVESTKHNYVACYGDPSVTSAFVEYRHFELRHVRPNIALDASTSRVFRLAVDEHSPCRPLVLIMPINFHRTTLHAGYFLLDGDLVVRLYSSYLLAACPNPVDAPSSYDDDDRNDNDDAGSSISVIDVGHDETMRRVRAAFARLGFFRHHSTRRDQIFAYDEYATIIVGNLENIDMPLVR